MTTAQRRMKSPNLKGQIFGLQDVPVGLADTTITNISRKYTGDLTSYFLDLLGAKRYIASYLVIFSRNHHLCVDGVIQALGTPQIRRPTRLFNHSRRTRVGLKNAPWEE